MKLVVRPSIQLLRLTTLVLLITGVSDPARAWQVVKSQQDVFPPSEQEPFDLLVLNAANKGVRIKIEPLPLTGTPRKLPGFPDQNATIRVRVPSHPGKEYDVQWRHIERIDLYEQMLMAEAEQRVKEERFDDAFRIFLRLKRDYPGITGLNATVQAFNVKNAIQLTKRREFGRALGMFEEMHRTTPNLRIAELQNIVPMQAIGVIVDQMVAGYLKEGDFRSARLLISRILEEWGPKAGQNLVRAQKQLIAKATVHYNNSIAAIRDRNLDLADREIRAMMRIWPDVTGGRQLATAIRERYPVVFVGVIRPATQHRPGEIGNWAARRTSGLVHRTLLEFNGPGPEGGVYSCPLGKVELDADRTQLTIALNGTTATGDVPTSGYDIADRLLELATVGSDSYLPAWSSLVKGIRVEDVMRVKVQFRRRHIIPQGLLQIPLTARPIPQGCLESGDGPYYVKSRTLKEVRFEVHDRKAAIARAQPAVIIEQSFDTPMDAIDALKRGEVDVLDHLFPSDAQMLVQADTGPNREIVVDRYAIPSVHMLIPNPDKPFTGSRTFRRAIMYGLNREVLLNREILNNETVEGFQIVSGPFPIGLRNNDPLAYGYDRSIEPRKWNPWLAATLVQLALIEQQAVAEKRKETPPDKIPTLTLAHASEELARVACGTIVNQLKIIGIDCQLKELPVGTTYDRDADLLYIEATISEPAVDARRLLAADGLARITNPYVALALRQLDVSEDWRDASERLRDLHGNIFNEVSVIPLWQAVDHFAYRRNVVGIGEQPITLYENVESWQLKQEPLDKDE